MKRLLGSSLRVGATVADANIPTPSPRSLAPSAYSTEFCHPIRRKVATQSTPKLPCNPSESCRLIRRKVATQSTPKLPPPSERSDATCFMGNLISPGLSMPLHVVPPDEGRLASGLSRPSRCSFRRLRSPHGPPRTSTRGGGTAPGLAPCVRRSCSVPRRHRYS
jgi:hypothetical protein